MRIVRFGFLALAAGVLACSDGPRAGEIVMELVGPRNDLAAVSFRAAASAPQTLDTVTAACAGCEVVVIRVSPAEFRGVLVGSALTGPVLRLAVSDVAAVASYGAQVVEAALSDYSLVGTSQMLFQPAASSQ